MEKSQQKKDLFSLSSGLKRSIRKLVVQRTSHFDGECLKKQGLIAADGSDNDKIKPEDFPEYHVQPPYNYIKATSALP